MNKALFHHQNGDLVEAVEYYTEVLKINSDHATANYNFGLLAMGLGQIQEALPFLKKAHEINPNVEQFKIAFNEAKNKLSNQNVQKLKPKKRLKKTSH